MVLCSSPPVLLLPVARSEEGTADLRNWRMPLGLGAAPHTAAVPGGSASFEVSGSAGGRGLPTVGGPERSQRQGTGAAHGAKREARRRRGGWKCGQHGCGRQVRGLLLLSPVCFTCADAAVLSCSCRARPATRMPTIFSMKYLKGGKLTHSKKRTLCNAYQATKHALR